MKIKKELNILWCLLTFLAFMETLTLLILLDLNKYYETIINKQQKQIAEVAQQYHDYYVNTENLVKEMKEEQKITMNCIVSGKW